MSTRKKEVLHIRSELKVLSYREKQREDRVFDEEEPEETTKEE